MKNERMVKRKYVELLSQTFVKYKKIEKICSEKMVNKVDNLIRKGNENPKCLDAANRKITVYSSIVKGVDSKKQTKERKNRKFYKMRPFSPDEDAVILEAMENDDLNLGDIAKELNRERDSVIWRVKKLRSTGTSRRCYKHYQFSEDCALIDAALKHLSICKSLELTVIPDIEAVAASLKREMNSTRFRWEKQLRVWLLRYYNKTLDLEIRPMLARVLADEFDSIEKIDWRMLTKYPEFSGHTDKSLRTVFYSVILPNAARRLKIDKFDLSLSQISEDAETNYRHPRIIKRVEQRKRDIVEYFESSVENLKIENFL